MRSVGIWLAGLFVLTAAGAASARESDQVVFACSGKFYDLGRVTPQRTFFRVDADGVQVWDPENGYWVRSSCLSRCLADRHRLSVLDGYVTANRGYVHHDLELDLRNGDLNEAWRVRDDVIELRGMCERASDPHPADQIVEPSTGSARDYSVKSIAYGLPVPAPRRSYELRLRVGGLQGRVPD